MITINVTDTPEADNKQEERIVKLEQDVADLTVAFEMMLKQLLSEKAAKGELGELEPCDCGNPNCAKQAAYEAQQAAQAKSSGLPSTGSGGQYI